MMLRRHFLITAVSTAFTYLFWKESNTNQTSTLPGRSHHDELLAWIQKNNPSYGPGFCQHPDCNRPEFTPTLEYKKQGLCQMHQSQCHWCFDYGYLTDLSKKGRGQKIPCRFCQAGVRGRCTGEIF